MSLHLTQTVFAMNAFSRPDLVSAQLDRLFKTTQAERVVEDAAFFAGAGPSGEASLSEMRRAQDALKTHQSGGALDQRTAFAVEAIILPRLRPVIDIQGSDYVIADPLWAHLAAGDAKTTLQKALPLIGRVELPGQNPPYAGTGFVVGEGLLMTNRHVAETFARGLGRRGLSFLAGRKAALNTSREIGGNPVEEEKMTLAVREIRMIHPWWDMAILAVDGLPAQRFLKLSVRRPEETLGADIAIVGYPALDERNNLDLQRRIFRNTFRVKRLQPGKVTGRTEIADSFGGVVRAATHDASTLGGNSGSAVIDPATGEVLGLHFAGEYLKANYFVPASELARDRFVREAGVVFDAGTADAATEWDMAWAAADAEATAAPAGVAVTTVTQGSMTVYLPVTITLTVGLPTVSAAAVPAPATLSERVSALVVDRNYTNRRGYDSGYLGLEVPMPTVSDPGAIAPRLDGLTDTALHYHHFSVVMHRTRRLAAFTAANVDGAATAKMPEPFRSYGRDDLTGLGDSPEIWITDDRVAPKYQLPDRFYENDRKAFDKGHIVRLDDVAFGANYDEVCAAVRDSLHATNCSPQVERFNRHGTWRALERTIEKQVTNARYSLFAGPIFAADDPLFDGHDDEGKVSIPIPVRYWKLVLLTENGSLAAYAFVLKQDLSGVRFTDREFAAPQTLIEQMVPVSVLQARIAPVVLPEVVIAADRYETPVAEAIRSVGRGIEGTGRSIWD
jgi:endonuclease G, mitochondrial